MKNIISILRYIISSIIIIFTIVTSCRILYSFFINELDLEGVVCLHVLLFFILAFGWLIWPRKKSLIRFYLRKIFQTSSTKAITPIKTDIHTKNTNSVLMDNSQNNPSRMIEGNEKEDESIGQLGFIYETKYKINQLLETVYIIENTSNIDTLIGRYQFFIKVVRDLSKYKSDPRYRMYLSEGVDYYKTLYYDKVVTDTQLKFVADPEDSQYIDFYSMNIVRCFDQYCRKMKAEISALKREAAKKNRIKKITEISHYCFEVLNSIGANPSYSEKIVDTLKQFGVEVEFDNKGKEPSTVVTSIDLGPVFGKALTKISRESTNGESKEVINDMPKSVSLLQDPPRSIIAISYKNEEENNISNLTTFIDIYLGIESGNNGFYFLTHSAKRLVDSFSEVCAVQKENLGTYDKKMKYLIKEVRKTFKFRMSPGLNTILENPNGNHDVIKTICLSQFKDGVDYWDKVLSSYSQKRAYYSRISYLLDQLSDIENLHLRIPDLDNLIVKQRNIYLLMQNS